MILVIDNYDSFTYNLVQYLSELDETATYRNDRLSLEEIARIDPDCIVISPGPGTPAESGISKAVIGAFAGKVPILGVCLGHQAIAEVFGGRVIRESVPFHGKVSRVHHCGTGIFTGMPDPFEATRYHSLVADPSRVPGELVVTAWTEDGTIMGLEHRKMPLYGVQFHPESILTKQGMTILENFHRRAERVYEGS